MRLPQPRGPLSRFLLERLTLPPGDELPPVDVDYGLEDEDEDDEDDEEDEDGGSR